MSEAEVLAAPACPECGGRVAYDLTCRTYGQDGRFYACMPCDSAVEYLCTEWLDDDHPGECSWRYTHGLNPANPRTAGNEANRPPWIMPGQEAGEWRAAGVRMLGG